ncbi:MAG: pantoate--beta-alanine ligase [Rhodospirillaceae bacterium]|nr:pantoate--beta-alanine ligase [Rhodospirillaceae bacterium]
MKIPIVRTLSALQKITREWRTANKEISVVPTMGALHAGHLSLVREAKSMSDKVIVTLFVNPTQFNNTKDLKSYPRSEEDDIKKLESFNIDLLYAPENHEIYPEGYATQISVSGVSEGLCGDHRPGHFNAVATVVAKLLIQTSANIALFGEKDYQQLHVIKRMVKDLDIPVRIVGCETIRETDHLAISSRNLLLSDKDRKRAPILAKTLMDAAKRIETGEPQKIVLEDSIKILRSSGFRSIEYLELRAESDLKVLEMVDEPARILASIYLGNVRLIDNVKVRFGNS